jgi:hypothetical protein
MAVRLAGYFLPFSHHVNERMIRLSDGELMVTIELEGLAFEAADDADLNDWRGKLNAAWRNVADPRIALHVHTVCLVESSSGQAERTTLIGMASYVAAAPGQPPQCTAALEDWASGLNDIFTGIHQSVTAKINLWMPLDGMKRKGFARG